MALARSLASKAEPAALGPEIRARLQRQFRLVLLVDLVCMLAAFAGIFGHVNLSQAWGMPLFTLAMLAGFGAQIAFIVALVKSSRPEKGV